MELGNGALAFVAQEEVAGPAAIHESVLGQAACAGCVLEDVEGCFLICVAVGVIEAHAMTGQVLECGLAKMVRENVALRLARGCVAAPALKQSAPHMCERPKSVEHRRIELLTFCMPSI